jgi:phosphoserine phosphatase
MQCRVASEIQRNLPKTISVLNFDIAGWGRAANRIGGDWYEWMALPDRGVAVGIFDVCGHGIDAALQMVGCRAYFRAAMECCNSLNEAFSTMNNWIINDMPEDKFITAAVGILDPLGSRMRFLSAGHGPILLYQASTDTVHSCMADDCPLAVMKDYAYSASKEIRFSSGDTLVLVTDGIVEWSNEQGQQFGTDRLARVIRARHGSSPHTLIEEIDREVLDFTRGTMQLDDTTAVVIKRH